MNNIINNIEYSNYITTTNDSIITLSENRSTYVLNNKNKREIYKLLIDNGIIKAGVKCDWALYLKLNNKQDTELYLYLIELKGSDIEHAFEQLFSTYKWFLKNTSNNCSLNYKIRLVCKKVCKVIQIEQGKKKFIKQNISDIIVKERIIENV